MAMRVGREGQRPGHCRNEQCLRFSTHFSPLENKPRRPFQRLYFYILPEARSWRPARRRQLAPRILGVILDDRIVLELFTVLALNHDRIIVLGNRPFICRGIRN